MNKSYTENAVKLNNRLIKSFTIDISTLIIEEGETEMALITITHQSEKCEMLSELLLLKRLQFTTSAKR